MVIFMNLLKRLCIILILFILYTCICAFSYASTVSNNISNSVFRLHILANSDSNDDQELKLKVRDNILEYMKSFSSDIDSKEKAITILEENLDAFEGIALQTIHDEGYNYDVNLYIGKYNFPTKTYGDISLPAGLYDALRVEIGEAKGHNWWCVMFPTLCFVDVSSGILDENSKEVLESNLNEEEYELVSGDNASVNFKFKILEFFNDIKVNLANVDI